MMDSSLGKRLHSIIKPDLYIIRGGGIYIYVQPRNAIYCIHNMANSTSWLLIVLLQYHHSAVYYRELFTLLRSLAEEQWICWWKMIVLQSKGKSMPRPQCQV